jgi:hypothetical protein
MGIEGIFLGRNICSAFLEFPERKGNFPKWKSK